MVWYLFFLFCFSSVSISPILFLFILFCISSLMLFVCLCSSSCDFPVFLSFDCVGIMFLSLSSSALWMSFVNLNISSSISIVLLCFLFSCCSFLPFGSFASSTGFSLLLLCLFLAFSSSSTLCMSAASLNISSSIVLALLRFLISSCPSVWFGPFLSSQLLGSVFLVSLYPSCFVSVHPLLLRRLIICLMLNSLWFSGSCGSCLRSCWRYSVVSSLVSPRRSRA